MLREKMAPHLAPATFFTLSIYERANVSIDPEIAREKVARLNDLIDTGLTIDDLGWFVIDGDR